MKNPFRVIIGILDRTPSSAKGQSLVELTLTLPIFLIMLLGLVEIGWIANNYLTLVDVTREAGRFGSTRDPLTFGLDDYRNFNRMDCDSELGQYNKFTQQNPPFTTWPGNEGVMRGLGYDAFEEDNLGFYDGIACTVVVSMLPLEFKDQIDDIVVSLFSYTVALDGTDTIYVTGRFPARSNECGSDNGDYRDPFAPPTLPIDQQDSQRVDVATDEGQRGFLFRGNHISDGCRGSEFSLTEIEDMLNRTTIFDDARTITDYEILEIPNNAFVLVEIFWEHDQLLGLPFFDIIGGDSEIHVWSFFPVSAAEPTATPSS